MFLTKIVKHSRNLNEKRRFKKIANLERILKQQARTLKKQLKFKNELELGKIQDLINKVIKEVADEEKFDLILYQEVAFASKRVNITPIISQKIRQRFK